MNHKNQAVREACTRSVSHVLANDTQGVVALEATRLVCKLVKDAQFKVRPEVLSVFTEQKGKQFEPKLVDILLDNIEQIEAIQTRYPDPV